MVRTLTISALLCFASTSAAEIFRWVDQDGRVHFSDRWSQGAQTVAASAPSKAPTDEPSAPLEPDSPNDPFFGPYASLAIVAPATNETLTQAEDGVPVSLMVSPALIEGHQMSVLLDGVALPVRNASTQFKLTNTTLGTHRLQIQITGTDGRLVAQSSPNSFHLEAPEEPGQIR